MKIIKQRYPLRTLAVLALALMALGSQPMQAHAAPESIVPTAACDPADCDQVSAAAPDFTLLPKFLVGDMRLEISSDTAVLTMVTLVSYEPFEVNGVCAERVEDPAGVGVFYSHTQMLWIGAVKGFNVHSGAGGGAQVWTYVLPTEPATFTARVSTI